MPAIPPSDVFKYHLSRFCPYEYFTKAIILMSLACLFNIPCRMQYYIHYNNEKGYRSAIALPIDKENILIYNYIIKKEQFLRNEKYMSSEH